MVGYLTLHSLAEGSEIEVSAPTGNFYLIDSKNVMYFISGGVGLTPMIAMLNQLVTEDMPQPVKALFMPAVAVKCMP